MSIRKKKLSSRRNRPTGSFNWNATAHPRRSIITQNYESLCNATCSTWMEYEIYNGKRKNKARKRWVTRLWQPKYGKSKSLKDTHLLRHSSWAKRRKTCPFHLCQKICLEWRFLFAASVMPKCTVYNWKRIMRHVVYSCSNIKPHFHAFITRTISQSSMLA